MKVDVYTCLISSPNDTNEERLLINNVFEEINRVMGKVHNFRLEQKTWEKDSWSSIGEDGQSVLNKQLLDGNHFVIVLMWNEFGTPTGRFNSGTEEEFFLAYDKLKDKQLIDIMCYFNKASPESMDDIDPKQLTKVREFKLKARSLGVKTTDYKGSTDFEKVLKNELNNRFLNIYNSNKEVKTKNMDESVSSYDIGTLHQAIDLFVKGTEKINHNSSKDDVEELEKVKADIFENLFKNYHDKIGAIPALKDKNIINLFERIYSSEKLNSSLYDDIINVRTDTANHHYYDRSVIVSSLTISLLSWKTFDQKKMELLIDFLCDFEEDVWQKSLTGLIISVMIHANRIQKFPLLIKRLQTLQEVEKIQVGIFIIDTILRNQLYNKVIFPKNIQKDAFLNETPYNWFYPFYKNNKTLQEAVAKTEQDIDINHFEDYIFKIPMIDAFKYALCDGLKNNCIEFVKIKDREIQRKRLEGFGHAHYFAPYFNLISEIYLYYNIFPKERVKNLFDKKNTLAETKLKNIILSKTQALNLAANLHFEKKEYKEAIGKLKDLLNIEPSQLSAIDQIAMCYENLKDYSNALIYYQQLENFKKDDIINLYNIASCYNKDKQFKKSNQYLLRLIAKKIEDKELSEYIYTLLGENYLLLEDYFNSIKYSEHAYNLNKKEQKIIGLLSIANKKLERYTEALKYQTKLCEMAPKKTLYQIDLALIHSEIEGDTVSVGIAEKVFLADGDVAEIAFSYARILFSKDIFEKSKIIFHKALKLKENESFIGVIYGNLGHIELFTGNEEKAIEYYKKCVLDFDDISRFEQCFNDDLKYALNNKISKSKYNSIKNKMILYWQVNK